MENLAVVTKNSRFWGQVCTWGQVRAPRGWGLRGDGPGKAGPGFAGRAGSSVTILCAALEVFLIV